MNEIEKAVILLGYMLDTEKNNLRYARTEDTKNYHNNNIESLNLAIKALEKQLNNGWIPVSKRLPELYDVNYLVTTESGDMIVSKFYGYGEECQGFKEYPEGVWEIDAYEETVIAWQPLPKKYKECKTQ